MVKPGNSKDSLRYKVVAEELQEFNNLITGHKKLLVAIGKL